MKLPIFPLQLIVFPGEQVNLHIFEQRYRNLFNELRNGKELFFGIPPVINNEIYGIGTKLNLLQVVKDYQSGEMDVIAEGIEVFSINKVFPQYLDKAFAGADVEILENDGAYDLIKFEALKILYNQFQSLMPQKKEIKNIQGEIYSFQIAHLSGLNELQKLELLGNPSEEERQEFMIEHFQKIIPSMQSIEETQKRILANGHFKNLKAFNFSKPV
ncbi:LON peptidase substrate-binding domain-containing protein [Pedobacter cryophilus]|uniref:Peptidase n=1 Tax=Pedobacter cryophilus TaxID=2571271 RepID=A0A4U1BZQ3_9SPHI|nr:LON peptidase substrate-binding domain-containing protein [Pedobacter cryophilus]TKB98702.1 peptidase [Pedobacter cryophilus]